MDNGKVNIHGKEYQTVGYRVHQFREKHGDKYSITTELVEAVDQRVVMKATILEGDRIIATGYAEEVRGSTNINKTSALENCETSAVGRCLAAFGMAGTEYATADEVANAIQQQAEIGIMERVNLHMNAVRDNLESVATIKQGIALGDHSVASEAWFELDDETKQALWVAPSKGGIFTTDERRVMQSAEFKQAYYGDSK